MGKEIKDHFVDSNKMVLWHISMTFPILSRDSAKVNTRLLIRHIRDNSSIADTIPELSAFYENCFESF